MSRSDKIATYIRVFLILVDSFLFIMACSEGQLIPAICWGLATLIYFGLVVHTVDKELQKRDRYILS